MRELGQMRFNEEYGLAFLDPTDPCSRPPSSRPHSPMTWCRYGDGQQPV